jgi:hypothetical protein
MRSTPAPRTRWRSAAGSTSSRFTPSTLCANFLRPFAPEDIRIDDFDATACAMLCAHTGRDDLRTATAHASGVHSWQGRMACELLTAADALSDAAILLLAHDDDCTIREKLQRGLHRLSSALHEGVRHSDQPARYDFRTTHFPAPPR